MAKHYFIYRRQNNLILRLYIHILVQTYRTLYNLLQIHNTYTCCAQFNNIHNDSNYRLIDIKFATSRTATPRNLINRLRIGKGRNKSLSNCILGLLNNVTCSIVILLKLYWIKEALEAYVSSF